MKRIFSVGAFLFLGLLPVFLLTACRPTTEQVVYAIDPGPRIRASEQYLSFGSLLPGQNASRTLSLRNIGTQNLVVRLIRTSEPDHILTQLHQQVIPPSEQEEIRVDLRSELYFEGPFEGSIVIYSNDPTQPVLKIKIEASYRSPLEWEPKFLDISVYHGEPAKIPEITILPKEGESLKPIRVSSPFSYLSASIKPNNSGGHIIELSLDPSAPLGLKEGFIEIHTNEPAFPLIKSLIRCRVLGDLSLEPANLHFGFVSHDQLAQARTKLTNRGRRDVRITKIEEKLPPDAHVDLNKDDLDCEINVTVAPSKTLQNLVGSITLFTDHPTENLLQLPTYGWLLAKHPFEPEIPRDQAIKLLGAALLRHDFLSPKDVVNKILGDIRDERSVSLLLTAMGSENWLIRARAMDVLGELGNLEALNQCRKSVTDDLHEEVRRSTVIALAKLAKIDALPEFALAIQDDFPLVRTEVADQLGRLGDKGAIPLLRKALFNLHFALP